MSYGRGTQIFLKSNSNLKIPGARRVTQIKFHTEDQEIFSGRVKNLVTLATRCPGFVHPWAKDNINYT
jgi:hypothetical protein